MSEAWNDYAAYLRKRIDLEITRMGTDFVIYDPESRKVHVVNRTACFILDKCDGQRSIEEVIGMVISDFSGSGKEDISKDVNECLQEFWKQGIIELLPEAEPDNPRDRKT